ncbi:MAG TPA: 50S ribosomal protein L19 [Candidatus Aminicenantes bacterium]|nr:50S ribosomal protein L19 [Candidatus Aminicenantes bacterium]
MTDDKKKSKERPADKPEKKKPEAAHADKRAREARSETPEIRPGDELKVSYRVIEAGKERIQTYEGTAIAIKNSGASRTVTVRKNSFGVAVERIFPLNSKLVQKIEVKKHTRVRRAKLFYLRSLKGKASRLKELR